MRLLAALAWRDSKNQENQLEVSALHLFITNICSRKIWEVSDYRTSLFISSTVARANSFTVLPLSFVKWSVISSTEYYSIIFHFLCNLLLLELKDIQLLYDQMLEVSALSL